MHEACSWVVKRSVKNSTLSLPTAWTGFGPNLYSCGLSSAGPALVESSKCKVLYAQQGQCEPQFLPHPRSQDGVQYIPPYMGCCQVGLCPADPSVQASGPQHLSAT